MWSRVGDAAARTDVRPLMARAAARTETKAGQGGGGEGERSVERRDTPARQRRGSQDQGRQLRESKGSPCSRRSRDRPLALASTACAVDASSEIAATLTSSSDQISVGPRGRFHALAPCGTGEARAVSRSRVVSAGSRDRASQRRVQAAESTSQLPLRLATGDRKPVKRALRRAPRRAWRGRRERPQGGAGTQAAAMAADERTAGR